MLGLGLRGLALLAAVIGLAMIFKKMGIQWWKAFIPVYGEYVLFKEVWNTNMFGVSLMNSLVLGSAMCATSAAVAAHNNTLGLIFMAFAIVSAIVEVTLTVMLLHKVSVSFGHGKGYTAGLVLLPPVFFNVLGFDNSEYQAA